MKFFLVLLCVGSCTAEIYNFIGDDSPTYDCAFCQPEQIHIAFGEKVNDIVVTWSTFNDTAESRVQYGVGLMQHEVQGSRSLFTEDGPEQREQWIHRVVLRDLNFNTRYVYHCGSQYGWSERFSFKTPLEGENGPVRAAIYGDMGVANAHSLSYLQDEAERDHFDMILHVGDFAYDMHERGARQGDDFMKQIQPLAAIVPYMTCPGNHEEAYNFSNYKARFSMPGRDASMFYSWDIGPVHFVAVNTEAYYFLNYGVQILLNQYEWLLEDLEEASKPNNRAKRPWIIVYGHRPMYCSNSDDADCSFEYTRKGLLGMYSLEPLLKEYGVDLVIWAHEHSYERTWPLYDQQVYNGSYNEPYVNPRAPVHIVTGSAGCREANDGFKDHPERWSAFRSKDYGYTRFVAHNKTHLYMEQVSVDQKGQVIDNFWLVKDNHGPYDI